MICGIEGSYMRHLRHIREIIGYQSGASDFAALSLMISSKGAFFIADTQVRPNPSAEELVDIAGRAAIHVQRFGITPKIAFVSHSDFGSYDTESSRKMRKAANLFAERHPEIEADGEMQGDTALSVAGRARLARGGGGADPPAFAPEGRGKHPDHAQSRCRQRRLSDDQGAGRRV